MFELHGWIVAIDGGADDDAARLAFADRIRSRAAAMNSQNPGVDVRWLNGSVVIALHGVTNHFGPAVSVVFEFCEWLADVAPDSYGLVYARDDEGHEKVFGAWVLMNGKFERRPEPFFGTLAPQ